MSTNSNALTSWFTKMYDGINLSGWYKQLVIFLGLLLVVSFVALLFGVNFINAGEMGTGYLFAVSVTLVFTISSIPFIGTFATAGSLLLPDVSGVDGGGATIRKAFWLYMFMVTSAGTIAATLIVIRILFNGHMIEGGSVAFVTVVLTIIGIATWLYGWKIDVYMIYTIGIHVVALILWITNYVDGTKEESGEARGKGIEAIQNFPTDIAIPAIKDIAAYGVFGLLMVVAVIALIRLILTKKSN